MTALERHNANMEAEIEPEPIERLRFFLSLALTGQDWIDVEQFIDGVSQQLAEREKQVTLLRGRLLASANYIDALGGNSFDPRRTLAATKHHDRS